MPHIHEIKDTEAHFMIDATTREISNADKLPALVQNDHNSERFTFVVPRYVDSHDMSLCDKVEILYENIQTSDKSKHFNGYIVNDLKVNPEDENTVIFSWLISDDSTQLVGNLNFSVRFYCASNYVWNTKIFEKIKVEKGMPKLNDSLPNEDDPDRTPEETLIAIEKLITESEVIAYDDTFNEFNDSFNDIYTD